MTTDNQEAQRQARAALDARRERQASEKFSAERERERRRRAWATGAGFVEEIAAGAPVHFDAGAMVEQRRQAMAAELAQEARLELLASIDAFMGAIAVALRDMAERLPAKRKR